MLLRCSAIVLRESQSALLASFCRETHNLLMHQDVRRIQGSRIVAGSGFSEGAASPSFVRKQWLIKSLLTCDATDRRASSFPLDGDGAWQSGVESNKTKS